LAAGKTESEHQIEKGGNLPGSIGAGADANPQGTKEGEQVTSCKRGSHRGFRVVPR